jgi:nitrate/nitrite-specific signal transduction histidine kinase
LIQKNELLQNTIEDLKRKSFEVNTQLKDENERLKAEFSKVTKEIGNVYLEYAHKINDKISDLGKGKKLTEKKRCI